MFYFFAYPFIRGNMDEASVIRTNSLSKCK
jgi:hypothetical protein